MDDLDDIRAALGYDRINLFGTSYGTRGALVYLRRYPERVRSVILKGVMGFELELTRDVERAARLLVDDCAADSACRERYPRIRAELAAVLRRLEQAPVAVEVTHPKTQRSARAMLGRDTFLATMLGVLQNVGSADQALDLIHRAARDDFAELGRLTVENHRGFETSISSGMALSVFCGENPQGAIGPDRVAGACSEWPRMEIPRGYGDPVRSTVPVLLVSGFLDPITPPRGAAKVAKHLPNSRHIVVRYASHSYTGLSPCLDGIMATFLEQAAVAGLDLSCIASIRRPPFAPPAAGSNF
jgi:pimeloyl-ACP methyl ester carboxylesterase